MKKTIGFIGGDERSRELSRIFLEKGYVVKTYGLFKDDEKDIDDFLKNATYLVGGIPFSRDSELINAPNFEEKISVTYFFHKMGKEQILIAGNISPKIKELASKQDIQTYDFLENEDIAIFNAIPTAEGAIDIALRLMPITLNGAKSLIIGYGRIGKILTDLLTGLHSDVSVVARKDEDFAWIKASGSKSLTYQHLDDDLNKFDVIFNTVPSLVLTEERLRKINKNCLIIDLASKPGGTDFEKAKEMNINVQWALGLPGKIAPKSAAIYLAAKIDDILKLER